MSINSSIRTRRLGIVLLTALGLLLSSFGQSFAALPVTSNPSLSLQRTIRTTPFAGSSVSMKDDEGSAFVESDNSLWLADDNGNAIYEINPATGQLKRTINRAAFNSAPRFGGGPQAGVNRTDDFEAMAYDKTHDWLYLFSGPCCVSSNLPTAFRLTRNGNGVFQVESHQPLLASGANYTAATWNPADGKIYTGNSNDLRTYDYLTNTAGADFSVPGVGGIFGLGFSSDGADLFVVNSAETLKRVDWASKTLVPGWTFDLTPFGVQDSRGVELINDQFYVSDGMDSRPAGPLRFAVFVFNVLAPPVAPVASFNANPTSGDAPLTVTFTDTSSGPPSSWDWDFGDGTPHSSAQNPTHTYSAPGPYTVTLSVSNSAGGPSTAQTTINVSTPPAPVASFTANPSSGTAPLSVNFTDTSQHAAEWHWDFDTTTPSEDSTQRNPTHVYNTQGIFTVSLRVVNAVGQADTTTRQITVTAPQNVVGNPGFEANTTGWGVTGSGAGVALTRVTTPVHTGTGAALLMNNSTANRKCVLNDVPNWVTTTQAGLYTASIWVRGGTAGKKIKITLKENDAGSVVGSRVVTYTLTAGWQQLTVTYTPVRAGTSTLDLQVFMAQDQAPPGICFYADDASILAS